METVKTKILLVEDDPSLGPLLQEYLEAQGFETKLAFTAREDDYAKVVARHWTELPGSHPIRSSELLEMLGRLRANFMTALRRVAPELEHHPWTRAWLVAVPGG